MKRLLYVGLACLVLFELANVYFVMPMPGSQRLRSIDLAYALYGWRWTIRALCGAMVLAGVPFAWRARQRRWPVPAALLAAAAVVYATNVRMAADRMFRQPTALRMVPPERSTVDTDRLVVGIEIDGAARATGAHAYALDGRGAAGVLAPVTAYQEFWHGWRTFHHGTTTY